MNFESIPNTKQSAGLKAGNTATPRRESSGFTLIELVISSAITAMILAGTYVCLRGAVSSRELIETRADAVQTARVAVGLIAADLRCATVLSKDYEFIGISRMIGKIEADNLDFGTHNYSPRAPREGDFCEVSYFVQKDEETGACSLWRRRDPTRDPNPLSGGNRELIAENILGLRFEFYDGLEWFDEWGDPDGKRLGSSSLFDPGNLKGLPYAVRITLLMNSNPKSTSTIRTAEENENLEPPLVFQTIARLNVPVLPDSPSSEAAAGGDDANQIPQQGPAPEGGRL